MEPSAVPTDDLERVADAQRRVSDAIAGLDDLDMKHRTALPGWTVAHVLTHLARNADSHIRRAEAAIRAEIVEQYPGGYEGRAREIQEGSVRVAADIIEDVLESGRRLQAAWSDLPQRAWAAVTRDVGGRKRPLSALPARRWQELEVHLVDLDVGPSYLSWSDEFVTVWLPRLRATLPARLPAAGRELPSRALGEREELAWLYGRLLPEDFPTLAPWS